MGQINIEREGVVHGACLMVQSSVMTVRCFRYKPGQWEAVEARVVREAPVTLSVNGAVWLTWMCTPADLEALAIGFLFNEGLIQSADEIANVNVCANGENVDVWTNHPVFTPPLWKRTSGCSGGVTAVGHPFSGNIDRDGRTFAPETVVDLMGQLLASQVLYRSAHGVHTSALSDGEKLVILAEDIGRHNTLDKIAGRYLIERMDLKHRILLTTGRISSEMLQKGARIGASVLISRTAPNALSIQIARDIGMTLIGYARGDQFQIYAHAERIHGAPTEEPTPAAVRSASQGDHQ